MSANLFSGFLPACGCSPGRHNVRRRRVLLRLYFVHTPRISYPRPADRQTAPHCPDNSSAICRSGQLDGIETPTAAHPGRVGLVFRGLSRNEHQACQTVGNGSFLPVLTDPRPNATLPTIRPAVRSSGGCRSPSSELCGIALFSRSLLPMGGMVFSRRKSGFRFDQPPNNR